MAASMPNVPGTGSKIPFNSYMAGITESYPNVSRQRIVETSINSKEKIDFMPTNIGLNKVLTDRYIEFRINGVTGCFLDMTSLVLEMMMKVKRGDNDLPDADHIALVNGLSNTMFKSATVFLNDKMVESTPIYNYVSYVKMLKTFKHNNVVNLGKCGFFNDDNKENVIKDVFTDASFANETLEGKLSPTIKRNGVHICFPLLLDLASIDMYLLDSVNVRIRLEMANNNWIMNTHTNGDANSFSIESVKLWVDRVTPHHNAMLALNKSLMISPVQYVFNKTLYKTYVIGTNQDSIMIDQPFGSCIPEKLTMMMVDMRNFSGNFDRNPLYFSNCDLTNIHISINGSTIYNIYSSFPSNITRLYYESQKSLGNDHENIISFDSFKNGRTVMTFNFMSEDMEDAIPVEVSASMRINLKFGTRMQNPTVIILLAETVGVLNIDHNRIVLCDVRG